MVKILKIADVLGVKTVLGRRIGSLNQLSHTVAAGLPKSSLRTTAKRVFADAAEQRRLMFRVVPEATYKRRGERLSASESERTERLARVIAACEDMWGDAEDTRRFLTTPHPELGGQTPLDGAMTELGARAVEELIEKITYGLPV